MKSCKTCKWLYVEPDSRGRIVVRKQKVYRCMYPVPDHPILPNSILGNSVFCWPPMRNYMTGSSGTDCMAWEQRVKDD